MIFTTFDQQRDLGINTKVSESSPTPGHRDAKREQGNLRLVVDFRVLNRLFNGIT